MVKPGTAKNSLSFREEELITKTNPILKSYQVSDADGLWKVTGESRFVVEANEETLKNERLKQVVKLINAEFVEKEIFSDPHAMVYSTESTPSDIMIRLADVSDITSATDSQEAYKITIDNSGIVIEAASENAAMYALRTIETMMITNGGLVYGIITDYPDVAERRLHVDCGRKYFSKDWFIRQIREMSYLKMNTLQMHFAENLGFRIECETDPQIVSEEHLTKAEVREILAEAEKYGIKVIPSLDTPGHTQHILQYHPEYGQINNDGTAHSEVALDVTNPAAVAYVYSLYDEYMELFEGCTDFHIGGDEYMEFDRAPFTTQYQRVLTNYAVEKWGTGYTWKDTMSNYINELAAHVYSKGFKPRIFNDGIYYGESSSPQKIQMHDYIGVDFWSQMSWNPSIARLQTFIDKGHTDIYNFNASFFYYVLRGSMPTDGREQHSFDVLNQEQNIYDNWTPGKFQSNTISDDHESISGVSMGIWCDYPDICTEDVIHEDIADALRSMACKSWNTSANTKMTYENFAALTEELGHAAAYEKGSRLPEVGEFMEGENLGKVTVKYEDTEGTSLRENRVLFGIIGNPYHITAEELYGYRFVSMSGAEDGVFSDTEITITLVYQLYTDKEVLDTAVQNRKGEADYIPATYGDYKAALAAAEEVLADGHATQAEVDAAYEALTAAEEQLVSIDRATLYLEIKFPVASAGYTASSYADYQSALREGETVLYNKEATGEEVEAARNHIRTAREALTPLPETDMITVTSTDPTYAFDGGYPMGNLMDNDLSTFAWLSDAQDVGDELKFTFSTPVILNSFRYQAPANAGDDIFFNAVVEVSRDGETWEEIGTLQSETDKTVAAEGRTVQYLRVRVVEAAKYWVKIAEVSFDYVTPGVDTSALSETIAAAEALKEEDYT